MNKVEYQMPEAVRARVSIKMIDTAFRVSDLAKDRLVEWACYLDVDMREVAARALKAFSKVRKNKDVESNNNSSDTTLSVVSVIESLETTKHTRLTSVQKWKFPESYVKRMDSKLFCQVVIWHTNNAGGIPGRN